MSASCEMQLECCVCMLWLASNTLERILFTLILCAKVWGCRSAGEWDRGSGGRKVCAASLLSPLCRPSSLLSSPLFFSSPPLFHLRSPLQRSPLSLSRYSCAPPYSPLFPSFLLCSFALLLIFASRLFPLALFPALLTPLSLPPLLGPPCSRLRSRRLCRALRVLSPVPSSSAAALFSLLSSLLSSPLCSSLWSVDLNPCSNDLDETERERKESGKKRAD